MVRCRLFSPMSPGGVLAHVGAVLAMTLLLGLVGTAQRADAEDRHGPLHVAVEAFFPEATPGGFQEVRLAVFNSWRRHALDVTVEGVTIDAAGEVTPFSGPFTVTLEPRAGFELVPLLLLSDETALGESTVLVTVEAVRTDAPGPDGDRGPRFSAEALATYEVVD